LHWAERIGLQESDAADLVQEVYVILVRVLPAFEYDRDKSFRAWLKTVFLNKWRERKRLRTPATGDNGLADVAQPTLSDDPEEVEYRRYLAQRALSFIEAEFSPILWKAFRAYALEGRPPEEIARELHIRPGTVYAIKSKVLFRLRQELRDLVD
jgi:RNA polymerase sigma-70 factor (ECF subfamily)